MSRPTNKMQLLDASYSNFEKLFTDINALSLPEQEKEFPPGTMNRNIRDVLAHLYHWHLMFLNWYETGMKGQKPTMPAEGYTWKTTPELNRHIHSLYIETPLKEIKKKIKDSHNKVMSIIEKHSNDQLFEKKHYQWTGSTSLGAYLVSATSSHYDWAIKLIKKVLKSPDFLK